MDKDKIEAARIAVQSAQTPMDIILAQATLFGVLQEAQGEMQDLLIESRNCLQALVSAISRQPTISAPKLQQDFLELCEMLYGAPENVPQFAQTLAMTAMNHGPAKS